MSDLGSLLEEVRDAARPEWTPDREERVRTGVNRALAWQRRKRLAFGATLSALLVVLFAVIALRPRAPAPPLAPVVASAAPRVAPALLRFADGSEVTSRSDDARIETMPAPGDAVVLRLRMGAARFSVVPRNGREFRVLAGDVTVTVIGTVFTVALEADGVRVGVERGKVRVSAPGAERELGAGEQAAFPELRAAEPAAVPSAQEAAASPVQRSAPASWRALAEEGNYAAALQRLRKEGPGAVRDRPEDLLLAADAARLGGSPAQAVAPLERLLARYSFDARAPLAAFTLGRTLLDQLGRPREAAQAFATARRLDASGALAQDALAREVESWSRAGEAALARSRANQYLTRYPDGRRAAAVRRLGGIE